MKRRVTLPPALDPDFPSEFSPPLDEEDERFDRVYPQRVRDRSDVHWTPARVARRAVELLDLSPACRVLDVGSGVGKFCLIAASHSPATFVGVERRPDLVDVAESARQTLAVSRVVFFHGDALQIDWTPFQGLYFFNPFVEYVLTDEDRLDAEAFDRNAYDRAVLIAQDRLDRMPVGTKVALYHGFGGGMPPAYRTMCRERCGNGILEVWTKAGIARPRIPTPEDASTNGPHDESGARLRIRHSERCRFRSQFPERHTESPTRSGMSFAELICRR